MTSPEARGVGGWMERRRLRYKRHETVGLDDVRGDLKTGDIIMFHKTTRSGVLDTIEMDVLAPLFFPENEFRHSGLVVRRGDHRDLHTAYRRQRQMCIRDSSCTEDVGAPSSRQRRAPPVRS